MTPGKPENTTTLIIVNVESTINEENSLSFPNQSPQEVNEEEGLANAGGTTDDCLVDATDWNNTGCNRFIAFADVQTFQGGGRNLFFSERNPTITFSEGGNAVGERESAGRKGLSLGVLIVWWLAWRRDGNDKHVFRAS